MGVQEVKKRATTDPLTRWKADLDAKLRRKGRELGLPKGIRATTDDLGIDDISIVTATLIDAYDARPEGPRKRMGRKTLERADARGLLQLCLKLRAEARTAEGRDAALVAGAILRMRQEDLLAIRVGRPRREDDAAGRMAAHGVAAVALKASEEASGPGASDGDLEVEDAATRATWAAIEAAEAAGDDAEASRLMAGVEDREPAEADRLDVAGILAHAAVSAALATAKAAGVDHAALEGMERAARDGWFALAKVAGRQERLDLAMLNLAMAHVGGIPEAFEDAGSGLDGAVAALDGEGRALHRTALAACVAAAADAPAAFRTAAFRTSALATARVVDVAGTVGGAIALERAADEDLGVMELAAHLRAEGVAAPWLTN